MTEAVQTYQFDIIPSTLQVKGNLPPGGYAEITFQVHNTSAHTVKAEAILDPLTGPVSAGGETVQPGDWASWLELVEPPEYEYQPDSIRTYTVQIKVPTVITPGKYRFKLLEVGLEDPDHEFVESEAVAFNVAIPPFNARWLIIGLVILLALALIGGVAAVLLTRSRSGLVRTLSAPSSVVVGQMARYTLTLNNKLSTPAENVVLDYTYPPGIEGAWAQVIMDPAGPVVTRCGSDDQVLRCTLGSLPPKQKVIVYINALVGPLPPALAPTPTLPPQITPSPTLRPTRTPAGQTVQSPGIDNTGSFTLRWVEKNVQNSEDLTPSQETTAVQPVNADNFPVSGAAIPANDVETVGQPEKISLIGWDNRTGSQPISLKYTLPRGMRFTDYPDTCTQDSADYFTLICSDTSLAQFDIVVVPLQASSSYAQNLAGGLDNTDTSKIAYKSLAPAANQIASIPAANNQLALNGKDEWVQLGYVGMPKTFTVEMWINPLSLEDGQAFIGAHRQTADKSRVINTFLVGYYNGAINVNVMDDYHNLSVAKTAAPFHLAVVVDSGSSSGKPIVKAYINGEAQNWEPANKCQGTDCQFANSITDPQPGDTPFNWVVGQDWDGDGSGIVTSDFFYGSVSDVRLSASALAQEQVQSDMYQPPLPLPFCTGKKGEICAPQQLIGWWPLSPSSSALLVQPGDCTLAKNGQADAQAQPAAACLVTDMGPNNYDGSRNGGAWVSTGARFGNALLFQGSNSGALYQPDIVLSNLEKGQNPAAIPVTLSAYVYVDSVPSQQQVIMADVFHPGHNNNMTSLIALVIDRDGHVMARYQSSTPEGPPSGKTMKDEKPITAGHWVHYGVVFWYDANNGTIADSYAKAHGLNGALLLFRDAQIVKGATPLPDLGSLDAPPNLKPGFYLGGLDPQEPLFSFDGRIDEVRLWARALYGPENKNSHLSAQLDLWRRLPGTAFDEYVYWSFDDDLGRSQNQPCNVGDACDHSDPRYQYPAAMDENGNAIGFPLTVNGPSWVPNDFSISYATQAVK